MDYKVIIKADPDFCMVIVIDTKSERSVETYNVFFFDIIPALKDLENLYEFNNISIVGNKEYSEKIKEDILKNMNKEYSVEVL